jgi:hypothetical protein
MLLAWAALAAAAVAALSVIESVPGATRAFDAQNASGVKIQMGLMLTAGLSILVLAVLNLLRRPDAESVLLFLWVVGTFWFAGFVNWTVNARSILPVAPAVGILLMRQIDARDKARPSFAAAPAVIPLILAGALSFSLARADWIAAAAARKAAVEVCIRYLSSDTNLWFQGHWGFQHYMQKLGAKPLDGARTRLPRGATVILPLGNTNILPLPPRSFEIRETLRMQVAPCIATMSESSGAGFYSSRSFGPLPYVLGPQPPDTYHVLQTVCPTVMPPGVLTRRRTLSR